MSNIYRVKLIIVYSDVQIISNAHLPVPKITISVVNKPMQFRDGHPFPQL